MKIIMFSFLWVIIVITEVIGEYALRYTERNNFCRARGKYQSFRTNEMPLAKYVNSSIPH